MYKRNNDLILSVTTECTDLNYQRYVINDWISKLTEFINEPSLRDKK